MHTLAVTHSSSPDEEACVRPQWLATIVMSQKCLETRPNYSMTNAKTKSSIEYSEPSNSHAHGNNPEIGQVS
jgi:hypothetical protein